MYIDIDKAKVFCPGAGNTDKSSVSWASQLAVVLHVTLYTSTEADLQMCIASCKCAWWFVCAPQYQNTQCTTSQGKHDDDRTLEQHEGCFDVLRMNQAKGDMGHWILCIYYLSDHKWDKKKQTHLLLLVVATFSCAEPSEYSQNRTEPILWGQWRPVWWQII